MILPVSSFIPFFQRIWQRRRHVAAADGEAPDDADEMVARDIAEEEMEEKTAEEKVGRKKVVWSTNGGEGSSGLGVRKKYFLL